jgi:hypothetical protein
MQQTLTQEDSLIAPTRARVERRTPRRVKNEIERETEANVRACAMAGPDAIDDRLQELDREWDIERTLEFNLAIVSLSGLALGAYVDSRWYWLTAVASGFMVQHVLDGWCPPVPAFRRMGVRTMQEIEHERYALKALRGDFEGIPGDRAPEDQAQEALEAARRP